MSLKERRILCVLQSSTLDGGIGFYDKKKSVHVREGGERRGEKKGGKYITARCVHMRASGGETM